MSVALWAAFAVDLGGRTFAEHIDTISETPEAEQLIDGTRSKINPALQELRDRVLGEYVEAPTWIAAPPGAAIPVERRSTGAREGQQRDREAAADERVPASTLTPEYEPRLPGRPRAASSDTPARADTPNYEPALPGRR